MARDVMTNAEMQASINAGVPVLYKGKVLKTLAQLPNDAQILLDYPEYAYTRIEGNARGLLGYEITGTPSDGVVPQFDGTNKRWNLNAVSGGSVTVPGLDTQLIFNNSGSLGATAGLSYSATNNTLSLKAQSNVKNALTIRDNNVTNDLPNVNWDDSSSYPALLMLGLHDTANFYQLAYYSELLGTIANYQGGGGDLNFDFLDANGTNQGSNYLLSRGGFAFICSAGGYYGWIGTIDLGVGEVFGLAHTYPPASQSVADLTWGNRGVTLRTPTTAITNTDLPASHLHFYLDEATDKLKVKWKESGGTVFDTAVLTGSGAVTSLAGTTNQITASASTGAVTLSLPASIHISNTMFVGSGAAGGIQFGDGGGVSGATHGFISSVSDGTFRIGDSAGGGSPQIILGSNNSGFVRLKRSGTNLSIRLGDDSADGGITASEATFNSAVTTGTGSSSGTVHTYNSLTSGTGANFSSSSISSGSLVNIASTSTAAASSTLKGLNIAISGANASVAQTVTGASISVTNTNVTSGTNVALTLTASGATTANTGISYTVGSATGYFAGDNGRGINLNGGILRYGFNYGGAWETGSSIILNGASQILGLKDDALLTFGPIPQSGDLFIRRSAAATLTLGAANANPPVAQNITVQGASGSNIAGANWTFIGSRGTGTGAGGAIIFQTAASGSTGSTQNSAATRLTIPTTGGIIIEPAAGAAPTASGTIAYDSTSNVVKAGVNGATVELTTWPISTYILAQPGSSQTILRIVFDRAVNIPAQSDGTNAYVKSGVAATAQTDFTVKKNGTTFATLRFAASGTQATWQSATSTDFAAGDMLTIVAPSSQDATLADIAFTITTKLK